MTSSAKRQPHTYGITTSSLPWPSCSCSCSSLSCHRNCSAAKVCLTLCLGLVIGFYNITAELLACLVPLCCIYAAKSNKNFNTVLAYCVLAIVAKVIQIAVLISFSHVGTCALPVIDRVPVAVYSGLELGCLAISAWILKRIKRVDR